MDKKFLIYGGIGAVALVGGFMLLNRGGGSEAAPAADSGYFPATVYSSGGGMQGGSSDTAFATGTTAAATDMNIAALLATQLSTAQMNADMTKFSATTEKEIALAGYTNSLAIAKEQSNASIMQGLASSLSGIIKTFQGSGSSTSTSGSSSSGFFGIGGGSSQSVQSSSYTNAVHGVEGNIGYQNGVISIDLNQSYNPALAATNENIANAAKIPAPAASQRRS